MNQLLVTTYSLLTARLNVHTYKWPSSLQVRSFSRFLSDVTWAVVAKGDQLRLNVSECRIVDSGESV